MKLLAVDLDNTLLRDDHSISDYTKERIAKMISLGHHFVIDTGRPPYRVGEIVKELDLDNDHSYIICYNGALIIKGNNEVLFDKKLEDKDVSVLVDLSKELNIGCLVYLNTHIEYDYLVEEVSFLKNLDCIVHNELGKDGLRELKDVYKVLYVGAPSDIDKVKKNIPDEIYKKYNVCQSGAKWIEIMPKDIDKGEGIIKLAEILDINDKDIYAVGDEENDLSMLEKVANPCAVDNAVPAVKKIVKYIAPSNMEDGVADIIDKFIIGDKNENLS